MTCHVSFSYDFLRTCKSYNLLHSPCYQCNHNHMHWWYDSLYHLPQRLWRRLVSWGHFLLHSPSIHKWVLCILVNSASAEVADSEWLFFHPLQTTVQGSSYLLGQRFLCVFCYEICTPEGRKGGVFKFQNKAHRTFDPRDTLCPVHSEAWSLEVAVWDRGRKNSKRFFSCDLLHSYFIWGKMTVNVQLGNCPMTTPGLHWWDFNNFSRPYVTGQNSKEFYRVSHDYCIFWHTPFLRRMLTQQAVLLCADQAKG